MRLNIKRSISMFLAFVFISFPIHAQAAGSFPKTGAVTNGFTVTERGVIDLINAETILFTHNKTGGQVLYIATDDKDRSFDISFKTPKLDSSGIPHVFEHACISGSEKYPSQSLFFPVMSQTYNSYVNAMTYDTMTTYPLSSLSEEQLLKLADFYLDGVFNPMLYTEERLFNREAWRYELTDADSPITITGTVYNEMKGNQVIQNAAYYNMLTALYPDSIVSNVNGGDPDYITDMTWQSLLDFHESYYHPSNALVILYGDLDYKKFLELIDEEYFSKYDKKEIVVETGEIEPITAPVNMTFEFPVEKSSKVQDASIINYSRVANGASLEECIGLSVLAQILTHESSPLIQAMRANLPNSNISASCSFITTPSAYLTILGDGLNEEDKEIFEETIESSLEKIASEGIDKKIIDALLAAEQFSNLTIPEMSNKGINISISLALMWASYDNLDYFNDYLEALDVIAAKADKGYFEDLLEKYILNNDHAALTVTKPVAGLAEENAAALAKSLADKKAAMSDEEIEEMVAATTELALWSAEEAPVELITSLQAVDVKTLPEETKIYDITDEDRDGIRVMTAEANVADIGKTALFFDTSEVAGEDLHYLNLYSALIGQVGTDMYSLTELQTLITRYLNGFLVSASAIKNGDSDYTPILTAQWLSLNNEYETCVELVNELLFKTDIYDTGTIKGIVGRLKNSMRSSINSTPYSYQYTRALATTSPQNAYNSYMKGIEYYQFLAEAEEILNENPDDFTARLKSVVDQISVRNNASVLFAGNSSGIEIFNDSIDTVFSGLSKNPPVTVDYAIELLVPDREAIIVDTTVQYNLLFASLEQLGIEYSGKLQPMSRLIYDAYVTPQIRHGIGAYDNIIQFTEEGLVFISYRDPSIEETYEVYQGMAEFIESAQFTQEDLDRYILSSYSGYAAPTGELNGAINALSLKLTGEPDDLILKTMREIKSFTVDDLKEMAEVFDKLNESGFRSTAGGAAIIGQNSQLFERVIDIGALTPESSAQGLTRAELISLLFGGAADSFQQAISLGIVSGDESGNYGEDEIVTREEFAVILARALGLPETEAPVKPDDFDLVSDWAKTAVDTLISYGILELDSNDCFNPGNSIGYSDFEAALNKITELSNAA